MTSPMFVGRVVVSVVAGMALAIGALAQTAPVPNSQPNPYGPGVKWGQLPPGRVWGNTSAVDVGADGHVWVADKCGALSCADKTDDPVFEFDAAGKLLHSFGAGLLISPHGIHIDRAGNVWVTDNGEAAGKGQQVLKFSREGKLLLSLGRAGVKGTDNDTFDQPTDVAIAPNGDIFVSEYNKFGRVHRFNKL